MRILVTGGTGQLGLELRRILPSAEYPTRKQLNLADTQSLLMFLKNNKYDLVINCAAYTNVDRAQEEQTECSALNVLAPKILSMHTSRIIHFSSDYVFNGKASNPYCESDKTSPLNFYGETKLLGEEAVLCVNPNAMIIRTSWLYSKTFGNNFFKTIRKLTQERSVLNVVFDQIGAPTNAQDLAKLVANNLIEHNPGGIFHYSNEGKASWYDFAMEINKKFPTECLINPIESSCYPTKAERPKYSVLDSSKIKKALSVEINHWKESLIYD